MSKYLQGLNNEQLEAVVYNGGPLAIVAAAGSGKTRVITHKIAYLIDELKVRPSEILAVTFTNKAASEMKERLVRMGAEGAEGVWMSTYHAMCAKILRSEIAVLGYPKNFNILDNIDQKQILAGVYRSLDISYKTVSYSSALDYISNHKMDEISYATAIDNARNDTEKLYGEIYKLYTIATERIKALDFDDLLLFVYNIFSKYDDVAEKWARRFTHVLVDEFQDTSFIQYTIVRKLARHSMITIVGDPDQTIYTWRKADANLINNFEKIFENGKIIKLELNYRSTKTILDKANELIKHNTRRIDKKLKATIGEGEPIEFYHGFSDDAEARWISKQILELKKHKNQLKDIAILYRSNYLSAPIEKALISDNIKYIIWGGIKFYQREEIKDAISFLKVIANGDEIALKRIINIPARKLGSVALESIYAQHEGSSEGLWDFINKNINQLDISNGQKQSLAAFINLINKYKELLKRGTPTSLIIEKFLIEVGYISSLSPVDDLSKIENLLELYKVIKSWEEENNSSSVDDYLEQVSLLLERDENTGNDFVTLMTVHNAKGLEFKNVFIAGFAESVFPSARAVEEGGEAALEEERRIAYVAVTRAKEKLFISDSRGYSIDHRHQKKPSRFLKEMGINAREFTTEFIAPVSHDENYHQENREFIVGDEVKHVTFGIGVVVSLQGELIEIAFKGPHGNKTLMKNHKSIMKAGGE